MNNYWLDRKEERKGRCIGSLVFNITIDEDAIYKRFCEAMERYGEDARQMLMGVDAANGDDSVTCSVTYTD